MVKITNGIETFEVSRGAFDGIYSRQGYILVKDEVVTHEKEEHVPEKTEDEMFLEEIVEKPISQWNKEELKRFAALNEIDIVGVKNAGEAKAIIKEFIEATSQE